MYMGLKFLESAPKVLEILLKRVRQLLVGMVFFNTIQNSSMALEVCENDLKRCFLTLVSYPYPARPDRRLSMTLDRVDGPMNEGNY